MSFAIVNYTGNGATTTYAITFPYITSSHVIVKVDNVLKTAGTDYTFPTSSTIQFTTAPANGLVISISRSSSRSARLVDYQDGATITEAILDQDSNQLFYISQEAFDTADNALLLDTDNKYNANSKIIKNVLNPVNAQDAVTKNYLENTWLSTADKATLTNLNSNIASVNAVNASLADVTTVANDLNEPVSEIDTVATNIANVNTVGTGIANVNTVAGISADITTLAGTAGLTTLASNAGNIATVAGQITPTNNISTVAGAVANIGTVATDIANVNSVGGSIANVNTVAGNNANITTVAGANANITTVATDIANVNLVGGSIANVNTVATNVANVNTVAGNNANINTVAGNNANINTVAGISADVTTVASNAGNISTVATDIAKVITAADDLNEAISEIDTVANAIANVDLVGNNIANVNLVGGSIANVNTVGSNIGTVNDFAARYRVSASDPSTSLDAGDLAFNTTANVLKYYNGTTWESIVAGGLTDIVQDGTPQLGGNLDVNGNSIVSTSNADINITPNGTGKVLLSSIPYPNTLGTAGQILKVNSGATGLDFGSNTITINGNAVALGGSTTINVGTFPTITSISPSTITNDATSFTITGTNFVSVPIVEAINASTGAIVRANSVSFTSSISISANFTLTVDGTYYIRVENNDGYAGRSTTALLTVSDAPIWSTSAGTLGTFSGGSSISTTVSATSDSAVTYSITTGSLPTGISLNSSTGAITGTESGATTDTTYSFTIRATDAETQTADRAFSITITVQINNGAQLN